MCDLLERLRTYEWLWRHAGFAEVADDLLMAADEIEELRAIATKMAVRSPDSDGTMFLELRTDRGRSALLPLVSQNDRRVGQEWQSMLGALPRKAVTSQPRQPG
jgi:hypothetical protein